MKKLIQLLLLLLAVANATAQEKSLMHKEEKRKYIVYTPASYESRAQQQFPVVVNVGFGMDYLKGTDDIGFTQALLAKLKQDYRVDEKRVYATGLSRGGFFSLRVAAELPQLFAAVASVGAPMPEPVIEHNAQPGKMGVMLMQGTADQVVAYEGKKGGYLSAADTFAYWGRANALGTAAVRERQFNGATADGTEVAIREQGDGGYSVALVTIKDGGHTWPGADAFNIGLPIGKTTQDIDANAVIWEFLSKHRK